MADIPEMIYYSQKKNLATWMILSKEEYPDVQQYILKEIVQKNEESAEEKLKVEHTKIKEYKIELLKYHDYEQIKSESEKKSKMLLECKDAILQAIPVFKKILVANNHSQILDEFCSVDRKITFSDFPFFTTLCEVVKNL
jgi:hypothetical protein